MIQAISIGLPANLSELMLDAQELQSRRRAAEDAQRIALELEMQKKIVSLSGNQWKKLFIEALQRKLSLSSNEMTALNAAAKLPSKVPNPKQCELLIQLLDRLKSEGVPLPSS